MAQWAEHHNDSPNQETRPQVAWPLPFKKVVSRNTYRLKLPYSFSQVHPVFLVTLLRPYNVDAITQHVQQVPPTPPIVHDGVEVYKV